MAASVDRRTADTTGRESQGPFLLAKLSSVYSLWKVGNETRYANLDEPGDGFIIVDVIRVKPEPQADLRFELFDRETGMAWIKGVEKGIREIHRVVGEESQNSLDLEVGSAPFEHFQPRKPG